MVEDPLPDQVKSLFQDLGQFFSDAQRNDRDNQDQEVAMELFDDIDDDMGDDGDEHDQEQDNEEGTNKLQLTPFASKLIEALLLNEIEALNEVHKYDLDTVEAIELEIEGERRKVIKLMWFRSSCI